MHGPLTDPAGGGGHAHAHGRAGHGHSHGLIDPSIKRSRAGLRAVGLSLAVLGLTAVARGAGLFVVLAIFASACVAGFEAVDRLFNPREPTHLLALALAGAIGFGGNWAAAIIRSRAGRRLDSPALVADGNHARADSYVSLAVVASAVVVALGLPVADPLIGLAITAVILKITWDSWWTVRGGHGHSH
ncbi:MAG TPA: cation transporter [Solirubrobacterales bacterium]|nr:cation transporter [Solirubrobacterales bacterium]